MSLSKNRKGRRTERKVKLPKPTAVDPASEDSPAMEHDRLSRWAARGWVQWVGLIATLSAAVFGGIAILPIVRAGVDPDAEVCRSFDADMSRDPHYPEREGVDATRVRRDVAISHRAEAQQDGDLAVALTGVIEAWDNLLVVYSDDPVNMQARGKELSGALEELGLVDQVCQDLGASMSGSAGIETADGSISDRDATAYCQDMREIVAAYSTVGAADPHVMYLNESIRNQATKGLPKEVYVATLVVMDHIYKALLNDDSTNPALQAGMDTVAVYCLGLGVRGWPSSADDQLMRN